MSNEEMIVRFKMRCAEMGITDANAQAALMMFSNQLMTLAADVLYENAPEGWTGDKDRPVVTARLLHLLWKFSVDAAQVARENGPQSVSVTLPIRLESVKAGTILYMMQAVMERRGFGDALEIHGLIGQPRGDGGN
jgi:hypothetical protein